MAKPKTEDSSEDAKKIVDDAKNFIEKAIGDIGKTSATKQLILGTASGWVTGFLTMKIGKIAAVGIGGSVILLHVASQKGYIDINWDKINKRVDKISDKIEKETTGKSTDWFEKIQAIPVERMSWSSMKDQSRYRSFPSVPFGYRCKFLKHTDVSLLKACPKGTVMAVYVERFVDRKLDKAEEVLKKKEVKAKRWYNNFTGDNQYHATESHVFLASFVAGMALGLVCGN